MGQPVQPTETAKKTVSHYVLTIEGLFVQAKDSKRYSVEVKIPNLGEGKKEGHYLTAALSPKYGRLLKQAIAKKYGSCEYIHTHELVKRVWVDASGNSHTAVADSKSSNSSSEQITFSNMKKSELLAYIKEMGYPIDLKVYTTVDAIRKALIDYQDNKEEFLKRQEEDKEQVRIKEEIKELEELDV